VEQRITRKTLPTIDRDFAIFFLTLVAISLLSSFWSIAPDESMIRSLKLAGVFLGGLLLLAGVQAFSPEDCRRVLRPLPLVIIVTAALFLIEVNFGYPLFLLYDGPQDTTRYTLYITNWAAVILVGLFWPTLQYMIDSKQNKTAVVAFTLLCLVAFFSTSESAILGFLVGISVFLGCRYIKKLPLVLFLLISGGLILSPWLAYWLFIFRPEFLVEMKGASAGQRMEIWDFLARQIFERPFIGWGVNSVDQMKLETDKVFFNGANVFHPHNAALQLWLEMGVAGVLLGLGFLTLLYKRMISVRPNIYMMAGFSSLLAVSLTAYGLWQGWWLGVMFLTAALFRVNLINSSVSAVKAEKGNDK
jgi:O-antigen ligase